MTNRHVVYEHGQYPLPYGESNRKMKGQLEELGEETDENVENISKMQGQILNMTGGKVNIFDASGDFKSTYEIMQGIASVWDDLSSIDQADLLETIAGKNRANDVAALLSNWENVEAAVKSASEAEGSAARENAKYVDSIQGRLDKMTTSWQSFANTFMSSDFLKGAISALTGFIEALEKVIDTFGTLPTLTGLLSGGLSLLKNQGLFKTLNNDLDGFTNKLGIANKSIAEIINAFNSGNSGGIQGFFNGLKSVKELFSSVSSDIDVSAISRYLDLLDSGVDRQKAFNDAMQGTSAATKDTVRAAGDNTAALRKMTTATNTSKAAMIGAKVAATLLNAALTMGISILIDWVVSGVMKAINASKELAESVDEVTSKYEEQYDALKKLKGDYDTSDEDAMISKYGKLSKGVDVFGKNLSLTADEYSEYQNIVDKIAEQIPSLVSGYDEQGNAILDCAGNIETLRNEYEKLIHTQNQEILSINAGDIQKNWENVLNGTDYSFWEKEGNYWTNLFSNWFADDNLESFDMKLYTAETLKDLVSGNISLDDIDWLNDKNIYNRKEIIQALQNAGHDIDSKVNLEEYLGNLLDTDPAQLQNIIDAYYAQFSEAIETYKTMATALLSEAFDVDSSISGLNYGNISEELQAIAYRTVNSLDFDFLNDLTEKGMTIEQWTKNMLNQLNALDSDANEEIETAFNLRTQFNDGDIPYGDYIDRIENAGKTINKMTLDDEVKSQLKLSIGLDESGFVKEYDELLARLTGTDRQGNPVKEVENAIGLDERKAKEFLNDLSVEEISVLTKVIPDIDAGATVEEIRRAMDRQMAVDGITFTLDLEYETESIDALNTAMAESVSASGLSSDSIAALKARFAELAADGYDLSAMFEETSNGIHLNRRAYGELEKEYAKRKQSQITEELGELENQYKLLTEDINNCTDASERASLYTQRDAILQQINDAATLAAQYEGLTSAYNDWQRAESAGSERDMYENIISGFETVEDEISRGWYDDGTLEFLELLTGKDLSTADIDEVKKAWKSVGETIEGTKYSVKDFFTTNDDGESTNTGVYNFLRAVESLENSDEAISKAKKLGYEIDDLIKRNEDGKIVGFNFEVLGGDKAIAEMLGISEELVQILLRAADDAGFVVTLDGEWTTLADLKNAAEQANNELKRLKSEGLDALKDVDDTDLEINFAAKTGDELNEELEKSLRILEKFKKNGKVDLEMEGAQEALDMAQYLQISLDKLSEPVYMELDSSDVEEEFREPLQKLKDFEDLVKQEHLLRIEGDTEGLAEVETKMNTIAKELYELDPTIKAQMEIDELSVDEIKEKLLSGEITVPANIELDIQMNQSLRDMVNIALYNAGLLGEGEEALIELEKRIDINAYAEEIDTSKLDEDTKEAVENGEYGKSVVEKPFTIEMVTDSIDTSKTVEEVEKAKEKIRERFSKEILMPYNEQTLEVAVDFLANTEEIDKYTPEQLNAIVKYIIETDDVEKYTPEQKDALVKFFANTTEPDGYTPEQKKAIVDYLAGTVNVDGYVPGDKEAIVKFLDDSTLPDSYQPDPKTGYVSFLVSKESPVFTWEAPLVYGDAAYTPYLSSTSLPAITGLTAYYTPAWESSGKGPAAGTAHADGTTGGRAFARGNWGLKDSGVALGGEMGTELVVRDGKFFTIGDSGAQFFRYRKNDIVFNAAQTESLFKYGGIKGANPRGKMLATGSAFAQGKAFSKGSGGDTEITVGVNSNTGKSYTKSSDSADDFEETIDLIEIAISRVERAIDNLDQKASNIYKSWSSRNSALKSEITEVRKEISAQQASYEKYMQAAAGVGLSSSWVNKIKNGAIDIDTITDEALKEKISDYQEWYLIMPIYLVINI